MTEQVLPPCQAGCPVRTDAGGYARLVAEGRYDEACEVICRTNPFPSVCAHICQRPCEKSCRRAQLDAPVALRALKRFVVDRAGARAERPAVSQGGAKGRVAVVGAGPAGLTVAHDLRVGGHGVHVFERLDRPGGMLNVIPRYRLPQAALDRDVGAILDADVEITYQCEVGRDLAVAELLERGFEAVVVASGLSRSRGIAVPGFGAQRFTAAIPWMADVWLGNKVDLGRRVAVIGGGNVAADVARTARRLGAEYVAMICLESREEMPAEPEEVALAEAEGIDILPRRALKRVLNRDGRIVAVELMAVLSVFDEAGRFRPTYDPSRIRTLSADMVVLSIGQAGDRSWARGAPVRADDRGRIVVDRGTQCTSHPRVFVAGESLRGPGSAIEAVADGHRAARIVAGFLDTGRTLAPPPDEAAALEPFPDDVIGMLHQMHTAAAEPEPFAEAEPVLDEPDARREGGRCLGCLAGAVVDETKCAACLTCFRVCPLDAIEIGETMAPNPVRCQACGVCASICPAGAIELAYWQPSALARQVPASHGAADRPSSVAVVCEYREGPDSERGDVLRVPCLGRLRPVDLLRLFGRGYQSVLLRACEQEQCKYGSAWKNIQSVADCVRGILDRVRPEAKIELEPAQQAGQGGGDRAGEA
jgi:NADPH-dependent glutamate synthase beta subunit-like oxidoreductase/Pyruvate/2-oxoacid:ferredoxin oxidoreductase delta subunit